MTFESDTYRKMLEEELAGALGLVDPRRVVLSALQWDPERHRAVIDGEEIAVEPGRRIYALGSGKASAAMGQALEEIFEDALHGGLIVTPAGTTRELRTIRLAGASHPIPDRSSLEATGELLGTASAIPQGSLVFYLLSGGSSALLCRPAAGLTLEDLAATHRELLGSGADIHQMNVVRTALSALKGGQLLEALSHCELVDLIISDVPGDEFRSIGSGPTTPGEIDYAEAVRILRDRGLIGRIPDRVAGWLEERAGQSARRMTPSHPGRHRQFLVSSARKLAGVVAERFERRGFSTRVIDPAYNAPIEEVERQILSDIRAEQERSGSGGSAAGGSGGASADGGAGGNGGEGQTGGNNADGWRCLVWYGESSVKVTGSGKGGRNQELALRIARNLEPGERVALASIGTDGVDGPTDAAGAIVDSQTVALATERGIDAEAYLRENDSYRFFERAGGLLKTGPTGNNLMDLQVALLW